MKKTSKNFTPIIIIFTALLIGTSSFSIKNSDLTEFKISVESTNNLVKLIGQKGTAFKELSFTMKENVPQEIDEFGMTSLEQSKMNRRDENLADFQFTIEKTNKGFVLIGKQGTAWTKLGFDFPKKNHYFVIDQSGVKLEEKANE